MTDVSSGFRWAPAWRLNTNLYKFGENVSPHIFDKKHRCGLNLGDSLCISTFFLFPDSGLNLLNVLIFILIYFEWRDTILKTSDSWQGNEPISCTLQQGSSPLEDLKFKFMVPIN